jgi:hypothetical protein
MVLTAAVVCVVLAAVLGTSGFGVAAEGEKAFTLTPDEYGIVLKTPDGRTVFRYMTKKPADSKLTANSVCCLFPVKTPSGEDVVEFAPVDHPHHRGVFLTWHAMQGKKPADFWGWGEWAPTKDRVIQNRGIRLAAADAKQATLAVHNVWLVEGEVMIDEFTDIMAREVKGAYVIDFDFRLTPTSDVTLRQTAFGGLCVKSRKDGKAAYYDPKGEVKLPAPHHLKPETDWPAAPWYDYTIQLDSGKTVGVAVLDHPGNPPSVWHNLAPIAMLNPCIVAPSPVTLKAKHGLQLRYRLVVHDGPTPTELLADLTKQWRGQKKGGGLALSDESVSAYSTEELVAALTDQITSIESLDCRFSIQYRDSATPVKCRYARSGKMWHYTELSGDQQQVNERTLCCDGNLLYTFSVTHQQPGEDKCDSVELQNPRAQGNLDPERLLGEGLSNVSRSVVDVLKLPGVTKSQETLPDGTIGVRLLAHAVPTAVAGPKQMKYDVAVTLDPKHSLLPREILITQSEENVTWPGWAHQWKIVEYRQCVDERTSRQRWFPVSGVLTQGSTGAPTIRMTVDEVRINAALPITLFCPTIPGAANVFDMRADGRGQRISP